MLLRDPDSLGLLKPREVYEDRIALRSLNDARCLLNHFGSRRRGSLDAKGLLSIPHSRIKITGLGVRCSE